MRIAFVAALATAVQAISVAPVPEPYELSAIDVDAETEAELEADVEAKLEAFVEAVCTSTVAANAEAFAAAEKLKELAKGVRVRDLPPGEPLFMFSLLPGKSRELNCFWDQGCSHLMLRDDVPERRPPPHCPG